ncbi:carboxylesterase/lipase family protein [Dictyobacter kobayashii]|uniref:Carboxylic ester hydrolase n=1 Tax=Dictyobacter kobayashii TaxID=2014872 RepID=A0A402AU13_9CHLR|nr:carboxylesterase/lipase family protein [Dictyobacter kobayashii]GCE22646.1 carboxylesterase [Dictyobacter kobayashii]
MAAGIVETRYGKIQGFEQKGIQVWKGIPYAQPPLGPLRFRAPQPPQAWSGVRETKKFGPNAAQPNDALGGFLGGMSTPPPSSEDCLYLNIWSPGADQQKRPVLVWIHGGAFVAGSGSEPWYNGDSFARNGDIVVVTINYRLGALGFLYLGELGGEEYASSANCGLQDQIAALEWVRDNIESFGGDPANVTIAGESAGAMSIGALLAAPRAQGLFQRAILESGAAHNVLSRDTAAGMTHAFLKHLDLSQTQLSALESLPVARILEAQQLNSRSTLGGPVIDGTVIPDSPLEMIAAGSAAQVSLLIGTNRDEARLFSLLSGREPKVNHAELERLFGTAGPEVFATYLQARDDHSEPYAWMDIVTDRTFRIPALRLVEKQLSHTSSVWVYRFDWPSPAFGGRLGACHALEIPFAWNTLDAEMSQLFIEESPAAQPIAATMHAVWIAFIRSGNPQTPQLPAWPGYQLTQRSTMLFHEHNQLTQDPQSVERQYWENII